MTATQEKRQTEIGRDRRRKEDQRLITGRTRWTDNITLPGMLHMAMVRSPFAHATITSIDTSAAKAAPNVVDVLTGADLGESQGVNINAWPITPDQVAPTHLPMPSDRVAFAGEIVACVIARTPAEARDAAELVDVEYEELPAALELKAAANDEVLAHPDLGTNKSALWVFNSGRGRHRRQRRRGDREGARRRHRHRARVPPAAADPRLHGAPLRGRRPDVRADDDVVGHAGPAHPAVRARRDDRGAGVEDPGDRARRRRRVRRQAPDHARRSGSPGPSRAGCRSR